MACGAALQGKDIDWEGAWSRDVMGNVQSAARMLNCLSPESSRLGTAYNQSKSSTAHTSIKTPTASLPKLRSLELPITGQNP